MAWKAAREPAGSICLLRGRWRRTDGFTSLARCRWSTASGNITAQSRQAISNLVAILKEAGYGTENVVRCGVWLDDPRDFSAFNAVFKEFFGDHPPARSCVASHMVVDCKVELDCVAYKAQKN